VCAFVLVRVPQLFGACLFTCVYVCTDKHERHTQTQLVLKIIASVDSPQRWSCASTASTDTYTHIHIYTHAHTLQVVPELAAAVEALQRWGCVRGFVVPMLVGMASCSQATRARMWAAGGLAALLALLEANQVCECGSV